MATVYLHRLVDTRATGRPSEYWEPTGRPGTHRRAAAVDGEAAAGSQGVGAASDGVSSPGGVGSCGGSVTSSGGGAPRRGPMAASPTKSAQGKDSWELAGASGRVVGVKRGRVRRGEGGHLPVAHRELRLSLSPSLRSERERVGSASAPVRGVER
jgi:hypothetical protein